MVRRVWLVVCFFMVGFLPVSAQFSAQDSTVQDSGRTLQTLQALQPRIHFSMEGLYLPAAMIGTGVLLDLSSGMKNTQLSFNKDHLPHFKTTADNYLLYVPAVIPYSLDMVGIPSKTDILNRSVILIKAEVLVAATGFALKRSIHEWRPDHSNHYSFPSGHSMQVFATATMLSEEYKDRFSWMPYAAYGFASGVGLLRIANNKHYLGDVLVGAGLGILSMKIAYWTHHYKWGKHPVKFK